MYICFKIKFVVVVVVVVVVVNVAYHRVRSLMESTQMPWCISKS